MADDTTQDTAPQDTPAPETGQPDDNGKGGKDAVLADLAKERSAKKAAERQLSELTKRLQEFEDRDKTESQKLTERAEMAERELNKTRAEALRARVGLAKGLPADLVERLRGETEDELSADADSLLALVTPGRPRGDVDQGVRGDGTAPQMSPTQAADLIRGRR